MTIRHITPKLLSWAPDVEPQALERALRCPRTLHQILNYKGL